MTDEKTDIAIVLGTNIKSYRKANNISQEALAEAVGITSQYVSNIECAVSFPSPAKIQAIAKVLKVPAYRLFIPEIISSDESNYMISKTALLEKLKWAVEDSIDSFLGSI